MADLPPFPGGIGITHLRVYDTEAPDGLRGGTPHVHSVCTEAYYVITGTGRVQTLTMGGFQETRLEAGRFVWFTPGTIHRLVNEGALEILVLMANRGLPEAGDMVITFPPDVLADPEVYERAAAVSVLDDAKARRDRAVEGFLPIRQALDAGDDALLRTFYAAAARILQPRAVSWNDVLRTGPVEALHAAKHALAAVERGEPDRLHEAGVHQLDASVAPKLGCCGTLGTYLAG